MQFKANHIRKEHIHRLTEHDRFGFDPADAPANHAQSVDHGGVRIGADQCVGESERSTFNEALKYHLGKVFQVDLVDDTGGRWNDAKVAEGFLTPLKEFVALPVALELDLRVALERFGSGKEIHLDGVVNDQVDGDERVDLFRVTTQASDRVAHGCQVDHSRDTGEILHDHTRRQEWDARALTLRL